MTAFYTSLIAVAVAAEIAVALAPKQGREQVKRIAALAALLVIAVPVRSIRENRGELILRAEELIRADASVSGRERYAEAAAGIMEYAKNRYGLGDLKTVFLEDGDGTLTEIQIYAKNCPYAVRTAMAEELEAAFSVPAAVFAGEGKEAGT